MARSDYFLRRDDVVKKKTIENEYELIWRGEDIKGAANKVFPF